MPISGKELEDLGSHPTPLPYCQGAPPVQRIIDLVDIHKYTIQDLPLHALNILEEFGSKTLYINTTLNTVKEADTNLVQGME